VLRKRFTIPQIDTLRVLATLGIFMHHLWGDRGVSEGIATPLAFFCNLGQFGVVFFNFMTGFVLALPYLGYECRPVPTWSQFLQRRFLRIVPAYYLAVLLFAGLNEFVFRHPITPEGLLRLLKQMFFLQGWDPMSLSSNTAAYWYLTLLAELYLVFPFVLRLFLRFQPRAACLLLCGVSWTFTAVLALPPVASHPLLQSLNPMIYFNLPARLPEFAMGIWLAAAWKPGRAPSRGLPVDRSFLLFTIVLLSFAVPATPWTHQISLPLSLIYEVSCSLGVFVALFLWTPMARLGQSVPLKRLSLASYGIYLVHQPLFSYWSNFFVTERAPMGWFALSFAVLAPVAYLLGRNLEPAAALVMTLPARLMNKRP
jgi:peptidoglycan/LPS O-acetylase OafA/YrhL